LTLAYHRIIFFEKIAPYYDISINLLTLGLYAKFLKKAVTILVPQKGEKILDLCSGTGTAASWMAQAVGKEGGVVGMDVAQRMVDVAKNRYGASGNVIFLPKNVRHPLGYQNHFDGIFTSFALHELPEAERLKVLERCYLALKEGGRMVIADFNPQASGIGKTILLAFFKLFDSENLNFFLFEQNQMLRRMGFGRIRIFLILGGLFQITLAHKLSE
jgi:ubiquinone/menaquinone biosynthesis C-methylase UbiE